MVNLNGRVTRLSTGTRALLLRTASVAALIAIVGPNPAIAQLAARRGPTVTAPPVAPNSSPGQNRSRGATEALNRSVATQSRADDIQSYVRQARAAAGAPPVVSDGLKGLVIARGVTSQTLAAGALLAVRDSTGRATWQGAALPVETVDGGKSLVTINQTESRAILSWDRFDVGRNTTLQFNQGNKDWIAVNRVVDPNASPTRILGSIKADGTVVVLNRNGVMFGNGAQVNVNSLLASSLELGNFAKVATRTIIDQNGNPQTQQAFFGLSLAERNINFLQNGLLQPSVRNGDLEVLAPNLVSAEFTGSFLAGDLKSAFNGPATGDVTVERGANITAGKGGFVILAAPTVSNDGTLAAVEGQVSLQAGRAISVTASTGATGSADPLIRGLILRTPFSNAGDSARNSGLIETARGYASLGAGLTGKVENAGLIAATTSVSRNGSISLTAGTISLSGSANQGEASGLVITPDKNGETVPQGTSAEPANFKTSRIQIGGAYIVPLDGVSNPLGELGPSAISIGENSLIYAPSANVEIGGKAGTSFFARQFANVVIPDGVATLAASKIDIAKGVLIDIGGVKDVLLDASRNSLLIDPLKRNELRDTPNYRETNTSGDFTLNGAAIYVDPRISGVRDDGVRFIGSPLIEAGSAASQIAVTAAELMTKGGNLSLNVATLENAAPLSSAPKITIARDAAIDFEGGWVRYADGIVRTSRLLTADGRIIDVGLANPNDQFVAIGDGFTEFQSKFGISRTYGNSILQGGRFEYGYDEGSDAGSVVISAPTATLDGTFRGSAFAGSRQNQNGKRPSKTSSVSGDLRRLQAGRGELPSGGYLRIGAFENTALTGDIVIGRGQSAVPLGAITLSDTALSSAGLSALSLKTSGGITVEQGANLTLANGGAFAAEAGRNIRLDGNITAASGIITAKTTDFGRDGGRSNGSAGSPFREDDNLTNVYASDPGLNPFDISVGGTLSTAGLWVNDFLSRDNPVGDAWGDGGAISLTVAPRVLVGIGNSANNLTGALDFSGSIRIARSALLDVSSGGYVGLDGTLDLTAKGGDISLINQTRYASVNLTETSTDATTSANQPLGGRNQTVTFTPYRVGDADIVPSLIPDRLVSEVSFDTASIKGFGFGGGGTFQLVAPDIAMGSAIGGKGPRIGLDFLSRTGFGTLDLAANKSRIVAGLFSNGNARNSAFLDTEIFKIGAGETLDLTQTVLPSLLDITTITQLTNLASGASITSILTPGIPQSPWDRKAANLVLGGVSELAVEADGAIIGAAGASITVPRLYSAGLIKIAGGKITQTDTLRTIVQESSSASRVVGVRDAAFGGGGLSDVLGGGIAGQQNGFDENALALVDAYPNTSGLQQLTNGQLFSLVNPSTNGNDDISLIFTGNVALNEGIHFTASSVTDLSGVALYNPRAPFLANGSQQRVGRVVSGGMISTAEFGEALSQSGYSNPIDPSSKLNAEAGARINLNGASGLFDQRISSTSFGAVTQWSDAGRMVIGNGALLTGANITAFGGDDGDSDISKTRANGGILDWVAPVIKQNDDGSFNSGSTLFAQHVMDAGFQSLVVRNSFTTDGEVNLNLGKSFIATTNDRLGRRTVNSLLINAAAGSRTAINANYIRLESGSQDVNTVGNTEGVGHISFGAKAIDIVGAVNLNVSSRTNGIDRGSASFEASGDIRLTGVAPQPTALGILPGLSGELLINGDLFFKAAQVYATTGTGDLQQLIEDRRAGRTERPNPFVVASTNVGGLVRFDGQPGAAPITPYSAGSYLRVLGAHIEQNGVLRAPLGLLELGANQSVAIGAIPSLVAPATISLTLGANSLTSVSARTSLSNDEALKIPYGTTTDTIEYFFSPGTSAVVTSTPVGELRLAGRDITIDSAAVGEIRVDARGGGDVFAFEFIPGTGGSRDVLDRFNADAFSSNDGLQFADGRQVYAIIPKNNATVAMFDPIYSADYGTAIGGDLYGANAGLSVTLDAAPGIAAGEYILLPARYALLPGALRIVENSGLDAPISGTTTTLLDGSILVGGVYSTAGAGFEQSQRRSFTIQTRDVFNKYSRIETTSGTTSAVTLAGRSNSIAPLLPRDAARVVLSPLTTLKVAGAFATAPAAGGLGAQVDIGGTKIRIAAAGATAETATQDYVLLTTDTLANFNAQSLSIGALRSNRSDGTTRLDVVTNTLVVDNDVNFSAPELLLAVGGPGSTLSIEDAPRGGTGAVLTATGILNDTRTGDFVINATGLAGSSPGIVDPTGAGALIRLANGPERLVTREGDFALRNSQLPARLDIGAGATLGATAITLDTSRTFAIDRTARIGAGPGGGEFTLALSADSLRIGGLAFASEIEAQFGLASRLTLRSPDIINFNPGTYQYKDLTIDAAGIGLTRPGALTNDVKLIADSVVLRNSSEDIGACKDVGARLCGANSSLTIDARDITFGSGQFRTSGFDAGLNGTGITLSARDGMYITGVGGFSSVNFDDNLDAPINLLTPFIVDRSAVDDPRQSYVRPQYSFSTVGAINVRNTTNTATIIAGPQAPGASIAFSAGNTFNGISSDITIDGTAIRATAGTVDVRATGSIFVKGSASISAPGYTRTFDDGIDKIIVTANGGVINLFSTGSVADSDTVIDAAATSSLIVDNGIGKAGTLNIAASLGRVNLLANLNPGIAANLSRSSSFSLDAGQSEFSFGDFVTNYGKRFQGNIAIRSGTGNLTLNAGQNVVADSLTLTADGGKVSIAGLIDTTGDNVTGLALTDPKYRDARIDGGNISLFGRNGVTLTSSASLISRTYGYGARDARQASGGNVTIGVGIPEQAGQTAALSIAAGATIDVGALRPGNRLISEFVTGQITRIESTIFRQALGDQGGLVSFRNPLLANNSINFSNQGQIKGAREVSIEAYRRFNLDDIFNSGQFSGIGLRELATDITTLNASEVIVGKANFLSDVATGTLPDFVRNFAVTGPNGETLNGYRLRPGIELNSVNDIQLSSNFNLGAGQIVNADGTPGYRDAVAAGYMVESPLGPYTSGPLAGQKRYEVVFGKEALLYERFVDMTYRVNGDVRGEAPVFTVRSQGNLDIRNSVSDGFFAFHDLTNADYINYQLGGGDRTFNPALNIGCGGVAAPGCGDSVLFSDVPPSRLAGPIGTRITIQIGTARQGTDIQPNVNAPYNPLANAVSAGGTGDPLGIAELFPLFEDGKSAHSSNINFVAGATNGSSNPLQINLSRSGSVTVSGETSYQIKGTRGSGRIAGPLQLTYNGPEVGNSDQAFYSLEELLSQINSGANPEFDSEFYTVLNWGAGTTGAAAEARTRALGYAAFQPDRFVGSQGNPTGVQARLSDVIAFLKNSGFAEAFSNGVEQNLPGFNSVTNIIPPLALLEFNTAYVGTSVRTGDGSINIMASNNIDLRRSQNAVLRTESAAVTSAQVGGTAVYTAGVRAARADLSGAILPSAQPIAQNFVPGPLSGLRLTPVFTKNGGSISLTAGNDVLGRRDVWNEINGENGSLTDAEIAVGGNVPSAFGGNQPTQRWRYGSVLATNSFAAIAPNFFTSGVGALSGGDVTIKAGRDVSDLTVALNNSLVTGSANGKQTLVTLASGDLALTVGRNINGGQFDIASGAAFAQVGGNVDAAGTTSTPGSFAGDARNLLRVRIADATFDLSANGSVTAGGIGALGVSALFGDRPSAENLGFYSSIAGARLTGTGDVTIVGNRPDQTVTLDGGFVLPPSLSLTSINSDIIFGNGRNLFTTNLLYASEYGQLSLLAGGDISNLALAMSDASPGHFFGGDTVLTTRYPVVGSSTSDTDLRILHNRRITHLNDPEAARIFAAGSINLADIYLPKQARISAGGDIINLYFQGQNVNSNDVTRISAGRDIIGTSAVGLNGRNTILGNSIIVGGPGTLFVEAGRDLGPFITSDGIEAGGIRTIGNEANPWLVPQGADIYAFFGVGKGIQYGAFESTYLNPANLARLDGDLFEQNEDTLGNKTPDRTRYTYAPILAEWLRANQPALFRSVFGSAVPSASDFYGRYAEIYAAFASLDQITRNRFLIDKLYFGELSAASNPNGQSFNQFIRGYRAVESLFPARLGYTDNLATYETNASGVPTKILVDGQPLAATTVETGNVDLRLSTIQTARGGDVTILGPGGNFVAGSVVRTDAQLTRRNTIERGTGLVNPNLLINRTRAIANIPLGAEGILTLRGGEVRGFTDGSFVLNQSRLFTQRGGDITLWSSNGDLNAGQGPKSSSNFPPISLRFNPNAFSEIDSAGSVAGAGIAAFRPSLDIEPSSVRLIAPVGTVDAGDAGVRASGDVFVAAARVVNADNFAAGGTVSGVPSIGAPAAPPVPASAASAIAANALRGADAAKQGASRLPRIFVDVLGYLGGGDKCADGQSPDANGECK